jgi:hypothetical protein
VIRVPPPCALLVALLLAAAPASGQTAGQRALGLCPSASTSLDGYMQALCDGEAALQSGDFGAAAERFRFAAALPRAEASNELAWAGLAAAHCHAQQSDAGRQWAAHFSQARRLWLGELDCEAAEGDARSQFSPFVRSRMCSDRLAADYALVRGNPQAAYAIDLRRRLQRIDEALAAACSSTGPAAQPQPAAASTAGAEAGKNKASQKSPGRKRSGAKRRGGAAKPKSG